MVATPTRTFMYGSFRTAGGTGLPFGIEHLYGVVPEREPDIAIEILREFSATELVGRLFTRGILGGNWTQGTMPGIKDYDWYQAFTTHKSVELVVRGSDPWTVLFFRPESDEAGPYVAVGLKLPIQDRH